MNRRQNGCVPTPWSVRWHRFRSGLLPWLCFATALAAVAVLWRQQGMHPNVIGRVEAKRVNVISGIDGRLLPLEELPEGGWRVFDVVQQGQVLARLDDSALRALVDALRGDVATFQKELEAKTAEVALEHYERQDQSQREASRLACELEKCRLEVLDRISLIQQDRIQLQRLNTQFEMVQMAMDRGVLSNWESRDTQTERDIVAKRIEDNTAALKVARENHDSALARQKSLAPPPQPDLKKLLAPIQASIVAAEARVREAEAQVDGLVLRSPFTGRISAIYYRPGQSVSAREWIMTIAADEADHIVGYIRPWQKIRPTPGDRVGVRASGTIGRTSDSTVEGAGAQWEPLPLEMARDQKVAELVLPVRIRPPDNLPLLPGQLVELSFYRTPEVSVQ